MAGAPQIVNRTRVYRAPGRVNLIGEHTDYNLGFVLPIAIDLSCVATISPAANGVLRVSSANLGQSRQWPIEAIRGASPAGDWGDYVLGVAQQLERAGFSIEAADLKLDSTVPVGAGLSSSAAIEVSTAMALLDDRPIAPKELALLCQRAEREFVGVPCGIMDQYASVFGERGKALQIDCREVTHEAVALPDNLAIVVVNSMVKHELGASAYQDRVRECKEAEDELRRWSPRVESLRDVKSAEIISLTGVPLKRARHITTENERVQAFVPASREGSLKTMGELFVASHRSLQHDYEVSCPELDFLVDTAVGIEGVYGARMTGGGFGGCTVNLVAPRSVPNFEQAIAAAYKRTWDRVPQVFRFVPDAGAQKIA